MSKIVKTFESFINEEKWVADVEPKKGKMHKLLNIPEEKKVSDVYTSGKKIAQDLLDATGDRKEATSMLAFAANTNKEDDIFDKALKIIKNLEEE
jgi:DNA-binding transcriptional regulator GbsR (MarR family)